MDTTITLSPKTNADELLRRLRNEIDFAENYPHSADYTCMRDLVDALYHLLRKEEPHAHQG